MRQKILESLKAKFTGVSDAILGRIADKLAKTTTTEEQVKTATDGVTFQQILESYGDSRATEAQQTAVTNYEKKYNLKEGKVIEDPKPKEEPTGSEDVPAWAKTLIETNKALSERLNKMETERTTTTRRQQLEDKIKALPETLRKGYQRTNVETLTDEEFTAMLTEVGTEVDGIVSDLKAKGAVFGRPATDGNGTTHQGEELTKDQQDAIAHRDGITAGDDKVQPF